MPKRTSRNILFQIQLCMTNLHPKSITFQRILQSCRRQCLTFVANLYCIRPGNEKGDRLRTSFDDIRVVHYSCQPKPSDWFLGSHGTREEFMRHIVGHYTTLLRKENGRHKNSDRIFRNVKSFIESYTEQACKEWYQCWDNMLQEVPQIQKLFWDLDPVAQTLEKKRKSNLPST